uniref:Uncharacterized protein n=1 Tax=Anopheles atroparvus TaxID=41427 RepID=A0AAG5CQP2_ANOAO
MKTNNNEGKASTGSVYHLLQSPAPICMFYFAHPFGIASPASGAKLAQIRDRATKGTKETPSNGPTTVASTAQTADSNSAKTQQTHKHRKSNGGSRKEPKPPKAHRKVNGLSSDRGKTVSKAKLEDAAVEQQTIKSKKHRTHRRISNFEKFLLDMQHCHTC